MEIINYNIEKVALAKSQAARKGTVSVSSSEYLVLTSANVQAAQTANINMMKKKVNRPPQYFQRRYSNQKLKRLSKSNRRKIQLLI